MQTQGIMTAFIMTLIAGASTGIGGLCALFVKKNNMRFLAGSLGFSAGVMIYIALGELLDRADEIIYTSYNNIGGFITAAAFFGGMAVIAVINRFIPEDGITAKLTKNTSDTAKTDAILRTGIAAALAMAIHNFPEGLATFISAAGLPETAAAIVTAIAIHNIPEGMAVAVPVYMATGSRRKAFMISLASGLTEPLGALIGYALLSPFLSPTLYAVLFAMTAGIMTYIAVSELIPASLKYGTAGDSTIGTVAGMAVMAIGVIVMR